MIDLHAHTNASDGTLTPEELVTEALKRGLTALAVTDHDTLAAIPAARQKAAGTSLEVIPGVEISTSMEENNFHILGLFVDETDRKFLAYLEGLFTARNRRAEKMVEKLRQLEIPITLDLVMKEASGGSIGRNHVAKALLNLGVVKARKEAFEKYLTRGRPGFVPHESSDPQAAIAAIREAGGLSFLAHPSLVRKQELIGRLVEWGLNGLEVIHPEHSPKQVREYAEYCASKHLLSSGGSDYHGPNMERKGDLGKMNVPEPFLTAIRHAWQERRRSL